jgi:hypothetical protein
MAAIMDNACSTKRAHALRPLSTLSSGYDSTTITVLAREAGLEDVLTFTRGFDGPSLGGPTESDSGAAVAQMLGLRCHAIEPDDRVALQEVPFFAANSSGEDVQFAGAARQLEGRLLLTGYYGGPNLGERAHERFPHARPTRRRRPQPLRIPPLGRLPQLRRAVLGHAIDRSDPCDHSLGGDEAVGYAGRL